jgi:hypothetical protein
MSRMLPTGIESLAPPVDSADRGPLRTNEQSGPGVSFSHVPTKCSHLNSRAWQWSPNVLLTTCEGYAADSEAVVVS